VLITLVRSVNNSRSVTLAFHSVVLAKKMALELFKPFIFFLSLASVAMARQSKPAKKMVERETPEVWISLERGFREHQ